MKITLFVLAIAAVTTAPTLSLAQTATTKGTFRNEAAALTWILRRLDATQGKAVVGALTNLEAKQVTGDGSRSYSMGNTMRLIVANSNDQVQMRSIWDRMATFDRESLTILARDAYFNGLEETGQKTEWLADFAGGNLPFGQGEIPETAILSSLVGLFDNQNGAALRKAILKLDAEGKQSKYANYGYINAEKMLVEALDESDRGAFVAAWKNMKYSEREGVCTLVRDAALGGLDDL